MTFQQTIWAINEAASMAAAAVRDAFADSADSQLPTARMAWEFLNECFADGDIERPFALPEFLTNQFEQEYRRLIRP